MPELVAKTEVALRPLPRSFEVPSLGDFAAGMPEDLLRCPVRAFSEYFDRTSCIVNRPRRLFVTSTCPSRVMSKNEISYMLRAFIIQSSASSQSGQVPRVPSNGGIATSSAFFRNWSLRSALEVVVTCEHAFSIFLFAGFILYFRWSSLSVHLLLLVNALGNSHLFLTCSGGGGGVILVCFPQQLA